MTNSIKILITTESHEVFNVRMNRRNAVHGLCPECGHATEMMTIDEAVSVSGLSTREILRNIESGDIHPIDTSSGHLLVCIHSLENFCVEGMHRDEGESGMAWAGEIRRLK